MKKKSKKNGIIEAFSASTQRRDNTYTSPTVMAPYKPVNTTSEFINEKPKEERPSLVNGRLVMPQKDLVVRKRNQNANPGLVNVSPEFELLSMGGGFGSMTAAKSAGSKITANAAKRMSIAGNVDNVASKKITQIELARDARIAKDEVKSFLNDDIVRETANKNSELAKRISSGNKNMADELKYPFIVDAETSTFRRANSINDLRDAYMYNKASVKFDNLPNGVSANIKKQAGINEISLNYSDNVATVAGTEGRVRALTHEYLHNARYGDTAIEQLKASKLLKSREELLRLANESKSSNLLVKDFGEGLHYLETAGETSTNMRDIAKLLNVNTGDKYPGWQGVKNILDSYKGDEKRFVFDALKLDTKRDYKRVWDAMTGKYLAAPAAVSATAIAAHQAKTNKTK